MPTIRPRVTCTRNAFRSICETAAANMTECVGLLVGKKTGGLRWRIEHVLPLGSCFADDSNIHYYKEDVDAAKKTAAQIHAPYVGVGLWHSHPWEKFEYVVMKPQLSAEDGKVMECGDLLILAVAFPVVGCKIPATKGAVLQRRVGQRIVRVEAWHKDENEKVTSCWISLR